MALRIGYDKIYGATITDTLGFTADNPGSNLIGPKRKAFARTSTTGGGVITISFDDLVDIDYVYMYRHNLQQADEWRVRLYDGTNQVYTSGSPIVVWQTGAAYDEWGWAQSYHFASNGPYSCDEVQITITEDSPNPDGYIEITQVMVGEYIEPAVNFDPGFDFGWDHDTDVERFQSGLQRGTIKNDDFHRRFACTFSHLTDAERASFSELFRQVGRRDQVFLSAFNAGTDPVVLIRDTTFAGRFTRGPRFTNDSRRFDQWTMSIEVEEG